MAKELRPTHELYSCDVCQRTILKGEHVEPYLVPGGQRRLVCDLCVGRAEREEWIRESAHADLPAGRQGPEPRPSLITRLSRWRVSPGNGASDGLESDAEEGSEEDLLGDSEDVGDPRDEAEGDPSLSEDAPLEE